MLKKYKSLDPMTRFTIVTTTINVAVVVAAGVIAKKMSDNS